MGEALLLRRIWPVVLAGLVAAILAAGGSRGVIAQNSGGASPPAPAAQGAVPTDETLKPLLDVLKDDAARNALIAELERQTGARADPDAAEPAPKIALPRRIAEMTLAVGEDLASVVSSISHDLRQLGILISHAWQLEPSVLIETYGGLISVVALTLTLFLLAWLLLRPIQARLERSHAARRPWARFAVIFALALLDGLAALLAYSAAWAGAIALFSKAGRLELGQSLFLNAFLFTELIKLMLRITIAPKVAALRLLPLNDRLACSAYCRLALVVSILGYGLMLAAPLATWNLNYGAGRSVEIVVLLAASLYAIMTVFAWRRMLRDGNLELQEADAASWLLNLLRIAWPWLATLYILAVFVIAATRPAAGMPFILSATGRSILIVFAGMAVMALLGRAVRKGLPLPESVESQLPLLRVRITRVVPTLFKTLRLVVIGAVLLGVIDSWGVINFGGWLGSEAGSAMLLSISSALMLAAVAYVIWLAVMSWIEYRLADHRGRVTGARQRTLLSLFSSAFTIVIAVIATMLVLSELGINIGPLIAGAGVVGLAVGFGAQTLVKDIITGAFIQVENAMNTGDVVTVAGVSGVVEKLSVRSIGIRDVNGTYHLVPFSAIGAVANQTRDYAYHVADIGIPYGISVTAAKHAMLEAFEQLGASEHALAIMGGLEMQGITTLGESAVVLRARIKTQPGAQWNIGRAYNELVKERMEAKGIEIVFPHAVVHVDAGRRPPPEDETKEPKPPKSEKPASRPASEGAASG